MSEEPSRPRALVTGGTTGIGLGIATAMADAGYEVTATGLTDEQVAAVPKRQHLSAVRLDVTSAESVAAVLAPFRELAALINCAGVIFRDGAEYDMATFQKVIDVNLTGTMRMCVGAHGKLAAARGSIINTASMLS
jgi:NAD(P)-dependent dehydrogenase (short-subunit alcohol dehydrogenase family)